MHLQYGTVSDEIVEIKIEVNDHLDGLVRVLDVYKNHCNS